jgi:hypothetical protein
VYLLENTFTGIKEEQKDERDKFNKNPVQPC